jgi:hypothetical protein
MPFVGTIANMKAELITQFKDIATNGDIIEMVVWHVPTPVPPTTHHYKYRLVYIVDNKRVIGFDNERGKGDHKHWGNVEHPYVFNDIDTLIEDFLLEVDKWKSVH